MPLSPGLVVTPDLGMEPRVRSLLSTKTELEMNDPRISQTCEDMNNVQWEKLYEAMCSKTWLCCSTSKDLCMTKAEGDTVYIAINLLLGPDFPLVYPAPHATIAYRAVFASYSELQCFKIAARVVLAGGGPFSCTLVPTGSRGSWDISSGCELHAAMKLIHGYLRHPDEEPFDFHVTWNRPNEPAKVFQLDFIRQCLYRFEQHLALRGAQEDEDLLGNTTLFEGEPDNEGTGQASDAKAD